MKQSCENKSTAGILINAERWWDFLQSCESPRHCLRLLFIVKHGIRFEHPKARHEIISHTLYETVPWVNFSDILEKSYWKAKIACLLHFYYNKTSPVQIISWGSHKSARSFLRCFWLRHVTVTIHFIFMHRKVLKWNTTVLHRILR